MSFIQNYKRYRWFITQSGVLVIGGKSAIQNDTLVKEATTDTETRLMMHTVAPGSPFSILCAPIDRLTPQDIEEAAIFTGCFSRAWKAGQRRAHIHLFSSTQLHKSPAMKQGTWGVKGAVQEQIVNLKLTLTKQRGILRAVPPASVIKTQLILTPGAIQKEDMLPKLELELNQSFNKEEILQALPTGGCKVSHE
ncbi:DUF814 domain-containing protein [Candidatus Pacearchaeota archaeon]|nr:DUF814 domain-containing protein [Candidatus Pacearchaeota archaeon]